MADPDTILNKELEGREAALRVAKILGCSGAHETPSGWKPCASPDTLAALVTGDEETFKKTYLRDVKRSGRGTVRRIISGDDIEEDKKKRPKKRVRRRRPKDNWENLTERGVISIQGGGPGLTSGKSAAGSGVVAVLIPSTESVADFIQKGGLPLDELHLTLGYFAKPENLPQSLKEDMVTWAYNMSQKFSPISGKIAGMAELGNDEPRAVVLMVENEDFQKVRDELDQGERGQHLDRTHPGFIPHMTLGYGIGIKGDIKGNITFDRVGVWWGSERLALPLQGNLAI